MGINPFTKSKIPIWVADYVLASYGTGAIMAVPAHDERDFEFANKYKLDIIRVVKSTQPLPYEGRGKMTNSDFINGLSSQAAIDKLIIEIEKQKIGKGHITYKLRDWLFSRQRYWGEPFPVIHYPQKEISVVPKNELPVLLPKVVSYEPSSDGRSPLASKQPVDVIERWR